MTNVPRWLRLLPLSLLAVMAVIALGIEALRLHPIDGGGVQWAVKLPLGVALALAFLARRVEPEPPPGD